MLLTGVNRSDGKWVNREYNNANEITRVTNSQNEEYIFRLNDNGWTLGQSYTKNGKLITQIDYDVWPYMLSDRGLPLHQNTTFYSYDHDLKATIIDKLTHDYVYFKEPKTSKVTGKRSVITQDETKESDYQSLELYHDSNGNTIGIAGQQDPDDKDNKEPIFTVLEASSQGLILSKSLLHGYNKQKVALTLAKRIMHFFTVNSEYLGMYDPVTGKSEKGFLAQLLTQAEAITYGIPANWRGLNGAFQYADVTPSVTHLPEVTQEEKHPGLQFSSPPPMPATYAVMGEAEGESASKIAENLYGSTSFTPQIEAANAIMGGDTIARGYPGLRLPQPINSHNQANTYVPFQLFTSKIMGPLTPYLQTPEVKFHPNPWNVLGKTLLAAVAIAVSAYFAPELAGFLIKSGVLMGGVFTASSEIIVASVTAGLIDAAGQGLAVGIGLQDKVSWTEVGGVALSAGVGYGLTTAIVGKDIAQTILRAGIDAVSQQLYQLATGPVHRFDLMPIATAMMTAGITRGLSIKAPTLQIPLNLTVGAIVPPLMEGKDFDIDLVVARSIGNIAGSAIGESLGSTLAHLNHNQEQYQKEQLASVNAKTATPQQLAQQSNRQKLEAISKPSKGTNPNVKRAQTFQLGRATTKNWEEVVSEKLLNDVKKSLNNSKAAPPRGVENWQIHDFYKDITTQNASGVLAAYGQGLAKGVFASLVAPFYIMDAAIKDPFVLTSALMKMNLNAVNLVMHPQQAIQSLRGSFDTFLSSDAITQAKLIGEMTAFSLTGFEGVAAKLFSTKLGLGFFGAVGSIKLTGRQANPVTLAKLIPGLGLWQKAKNYTLFSPATKSALLNKGVTQITPELVDAMRSKGRVIDVATKGSEDYNYLLYMGAEGSINTAVPNHILIREDASKSALIEEFLHGTQVKLEIVGKLSAQEAEIHVKDFMIRHASMLGLNSSADLQLLQQLKIEEIERLSFLESKK